MDASQIIDDVFGGPTKAAELLKVTPAAACNWKASGVFPARLHVKIWQEVVARGHAVALTDIPVTDPPPRLSKNTKEVAA